MAFKTLDYPSPPEHDEGPCRSCDCWAECPCGCGMGFCDYKGEFTDRTFRCAAWWDGDRGDE